MKRILVGSTIIAGSLLAASPARASGFLAARFGGEHGHPTTDNPTAIYYNPAGLALTPFGPSDDEPGKFHLKLYVDGVLAYRTASYTRPQEAIDNPGTGTPTEAIGANAGEANLNNWIASPFVSVSSDFGIENFGAGLAFYVPFGGVAEWDQNEDFPKELQAKYPGAIDGVQRWWTMDGRIQSSYITAGAAYRFEGIRLTLGVNLSAVNSKVNTIRARNSDGSDDLISQGANPGEQSLKEGRSWIDVDGWNIAAGAGVIWEPIEQLWLGVSYQSKPGFGKMTLDGELHTTLSTSQPEVTKVELEQTLPDVWRFGARYRLERSWEFRLFGELVNWSAFDRQCILNKVRTSNPKCSLNPDGSPKPGPSDVTQNIPRNWEDAWGLRAGVSYWVSKPVELYVGGGYDSNAVPDSTMDPALMDMPKFTAAVGTEIQLTPRWFLSGTLTEVFYNDRTVAVDEITRFQPPSRQPNSAGRYTQGITVLDVYTGYTF